MHFIIDTIHGTGLETNTFREDTPCCPIDYIHRTGLQTTRVSHLDKNIFTKMWKDVGIEVPKSIETRSKFPRSNKSPRHHHLLAAKATKPITACSFDGTGLKWGDT